jgi:hypothetical protein
LPDSQGFDQTSNPTFAKLLEVDSELAVTEAQLFSQLESVQEKRRSLRTVINLFTTADTPATAPVESPAQNPPGENDRELEPVFEDLATPQLGTSGATAEPETEAAPATQSKEAKTTLSSKTMMGTTFKKKAKAANKGLGWQQYVREEFSRTSLPSAVYAVLQRQTERVFEISALVNAIFVDEIPDQLRSKVRRQVSNILSSGARQNKWYRSQLGQYSMSEAAVVNSSV